MKYGKMTLGQIEAVLNTVGGEAGAKCLLDGFSEVVLKDGVIDCDAAPQLGSSAGRVISHKKHGYVHWDPTGFTMYTTEKQKEDHGPDGEQLLRDVSSLRVVNANVLDYLLENPHEIPESWKFGHHCNALYIIFWGTIYDDEDGVRYVRALHYCEESDVWQSEDLSLDWREDEHWEWNDLCVALLWM